MAVALAVVAVAFAWGSDQVSAQQTYAQTYPSGIGFNPNVDYRLPNYSYSPNLRKFVDGLPGVGITNSNNLGQYIPLAISDTNAYPGSDFYSIALTAYNIKMHSDMPVTNIRGYSQINAQSDPTVQNVAQYLGPLILARRYDPTKPAGVNGNGRPVRVKFTNNLLPTPAGNLPLSVDTTAMGAGMGPGGVAFTQNRATVHLHGGLTPWISDGTPHQWIVPAADPTTLKKGVSHTNVPDMIGSGVTQVTNTAGDGQTTFYWSNQQSGRLMFYHDHAWGITRLNVYAGEAAGYLLVDQVEDDLIQATNTSGVFGTGPVTQMLPNLGGVYKYGIPLVFQDRTFVNDATTTPNPNVTTTNNPYTTNSPYKPSELTSAVDPNWFKPGWVTATGTSGIGTTGGSLWYPHEYLPIENIFDPSGGTPTGRWDYAPFMIPPMQPTILQLPSPSMVPEAFCDTAMVNGTVLPYVKLPPTVVRFRILNACNDRSINLQIYKAEPLTVRVVEGGTGYTTAGVTFSAPTAGVTATGTAQVLNGAVTGITITNPGSGYLTSAPPTATITGPGTGAKAITAVNTEVKMVPAAPNTAYPTWPKDGRDGGVPDPTTQGPPWVQIGNEGGLLAQLNVIPQQPVDFDYNRQHVPFASVIKNSLLIMPAVRADVLLDLSSYNDGDVLIVYNDAPAPMSGFWPINDCYADCPDQAATGGPHSVPPGFGPNTRTYMQIRMTGTNPFPGYVLNTTALGAILPKAFAAGSDKPLVPQLAYNAAFPGFATTDIYAQSTDQTLNLSGAGTGIAQIRTTLPGAGYTTAPTVMVISNTGTGCIATAGLNPCGGVTLLTAGAGYTTPPTITISAPGGTGTTATALATVSGGQVTAINMVEPGSGYSTTVAPTVTITGGGGAGATASAFVATAGLVGSIKVTTPGSGYVRQPMVYLVGGGGMGAGATALTTGSLIMTSKNMTEGFDVNYGRMDIRLGSTPNPLTPNIGAGFVLGIAQYIDPPTEFINGNETILWRITHLGVDSHALHFHLFNLQLVNRIDWTNGLKPPMPEEIGWKETIRTNPMEDIIIAIKPYSPVLPFAIPPSVRLLDPSALINATTNFNPVPPPIGIAAVPQLTNVMTNFGWEYVWHCHLLGHEENDMMRPMCFMAEPNPPVNPVATGGNARVTVAFTPPVNPGISAITGYTATVTSGAQTFTATGTATARSLTVTGLTNGNTYTVSVTCKNASGTSNPAVSNSVTLATAVPNGAPTLMTAAAAVLGSGQPVVNLAWKDNSTNESSFTVQRATNAGFTANLTSIVVPGSSPATTVLAVAFQDTTANPSTTYFYRVAATNSMGNTTFAVSTPASVTTAAWLPVAPTALALTSVTTTSALLHWTPGTPANWTGFRLYRSTAGVNGPWTLVNTLAATATTSSNTGLRTKTNYWYRIASYNASGTSAFSNVLAVRTN
jgi:FtsP/CotA-like multicopper oxidase with cupredoxin domain